MLNNMCKIMLSKKNVFFRNLVKIEKLLKKR